MVMTEMETAFSFLASGPTFRLRLPADFDPVPELSSPLDNGRGGRSFIFIPSNRDEGVTDSVPLGTLVDRDGRSVDLYERVAPPPLWRLRWQLRSGAVYTHLREEDGVEMAEVTVASVSIVEETTGRTPFVLAYPPLVFAGSSRPGYQEEAIYFSSARGDGWSVTLQRPSFMKPGTVAIAPKQNTGGLVAIKAGLDFGIELSVWAGTDRFAGEAIVAMVRGSLRES